MNLSALLLCAAAFFNPADYPVERPAPVVKDGLRVLMIGNFNWQGDYFATYLNAWMCLTPSAKGVRLYKHFEDIPAAKTFAEVLPVRLKLSGADVVCVFLGNDAGYYGTDEKALDAFRSVLADLKGSADAAGATLILVSMPAKPAWQPDGKENRELAVYADAMHRFAKEKKCGFFDLHAFSLGFARPAAAGNADTLRTAHAFMHLLGLALPPIPVLDVDFAALQPKYEIVTELPPLGFTYCDQEASEVTGFIVKSANPPAGGAKVVWLGGSVTLTAEELKAGCNLIGKRPGWSPCRDSGLGLLNAGNLFWNEQMLLQRLPSFERTVAKMDEGGDNAALFATLEREYLRALDEDFAAYHAKRAPARCTFIITPIEK